MAPAQDITSTVHPALVWYPATSRPWSLVLKSVVVVILSTLIESRRNGLEALMPPTSATLRSAHGSRTQATERLVQAPDPEHNWMYAACRPD